MGISSEDNSRTVHYWQWHRSPLRLRPLRSRHAFGLCLHYHGQHLHHRESLSLSQPWRSRAHIFLRIPRRHPRPCLRHYNPTDGRWGGRDPSYLLLQSLYGFIHNSFGRVDFLGLIFLKNNFIKEKERCLCSGCGILSGCLKVI